jgi:MATE family multidrug resistance protein
VGQALTALVGKSIGGGGASRAIRETRYAAIITLVYMGSLSLVYWLFGGRLIGAFNDSPDVVRIGTGIMICAAVFQLFDAIGITYNSALRGAGDTFVPSVVFIISSWVIILGGGAGAVALYPDLGSLGPWMAASGFIAFTSVFLWWRWRSGAWKTIDLFREKAAQRRSEVTGAAALESDSTEVGPAANPAE